MFSPFWALNVLTCLRDHSELAVVKTENNLQFFWCERERKEQNKAERKAAETIYVCETENWNCQISIILIFRLFVDFQRELSWKLLSFCVMIFDGNLETAILITCNEALTLFRLTGWVSSRKEVSEFSSGKVQANSEQHRVPRFIQNRILIVVRSGWWRKSSEKAFIVSALAAADCFRFEKSEIRVTTDSKFASRLLSRKTFEAQNRNWICGKSY